MMIDAVPAMAPNIAGNQVRALATTGQQRSAVLPNVPTANEAGVSGYEATIWLGLMAPAGTPKPVIDKLNAAVNAMVKRPDIIKLWTEQGAVPMSMTPEEFEKFLRGDIEKWADVVKKFDKSLRPVMPAIQFRLNGAEVALDADPDQALLDVLRGRLGVTSPHFGCGAGECGACYVMVGDRAMASCDMPMWSVAEKDVVTVEGLGTVEQPHPLQRAFISEQAMQCGYCVPGILISAAALLKRNPSPTEAEVRTALDRNLCRCGSHNRMVRAVLRAASEMATS